MARSTSRVVAAKPPRIKTAVLLTPEAFRRLGACCLSESMTQSDVIERLINRSLAGYVLQVRGERINPVASTVSASHTSNEEVDGEKAA